MTSLDNLRKAAKRWLKALRANDPDAIARLQRVYPAAASSPTLRDVQHALAIERGAESWRALIKRLESSQPAASPLPALLAAAAAGDAERVALLADEHPEIVSERGALPGHTGLRSALHFGVAHEPVVRALLERGADPNVRDEGDNAFPLHFAAENQHLSIIRLLIEHGADPIGDGDHHELDVIGWACCWDYREPNAEVVNYLLAHGARHNIFSAVAMGDIEAVQQLVALDRALLVRRMDRTNMRRTALHLAVIKRQPAVADRLVDLGADLEIEDAAGLTPLDQAALNGDRALSDLLIARGAPLRLPAAVALERTDEIARVLAGNPDVLKPGQQYGTLIIRAARTVAGPVIEALIRHGASVHARDDTETSVDGVSGYTALHAAAFHGNESAVRALLQRGADVAAREDKYGATPVGWANYAGHREIRNLLLRGAIDIFDVIEFDTVERIPQLLKTDPAALNRPFSEYVKAERFAPDGWVTPLAFAVIENNVEATKYLLEAGAQPGVAPNQGTLDDIAAAPGREDVARVLRDHKGEKAGPVQNADEERVAAFLEFACWDHRIHGAADHRMCDRAAQRLLAHYPEIARNSLYTAIVCGDLPGVRRILEERPDAARLRGGARAWTPILYLCYARFSHPPALENCVAILKELLDRGADPNDYYMAGHSRYSALVGVAREGEQQAPPHPRREELFQLLIERGANIYDPQVLYNNHFSGDLLWWLKLVHAHAVKIGRTEEWNDPQWSMLDMGGYGPGAVYILGIAVEKNDLELCAWALTHGASPNAMNPKHPRYSPTPTLYAEAVRRGHTGIADLLRRYGAHTGITPLAGEEAFIDACFRLDRAEAQAHLARHPYYLRSPQAMFAAAAHDRPDAIALLLALGVPLEIADSENTRALHHAAAANSLRAAKYLIEQGAEVDPRETRYGATPIGWAAHGDRAAMVDFLSEYSRNVWTLAFRGYVDRLRTVLSDQPELAKVSSEDGTTPLWWLPDDEDRALAIVELLLAHGADPEATSKQGTTAADWARKRGMLRVVERLQPQPQKTSVGP